MQHMDLNSNSTENYEIFGEILNPEGISDIKELNFKGVVILFKSCLRLKKKKEQSFHLLKIHI